MTTNSCLSAGLAAAVCAALCAGAAEAADVQVYGVLDMGFSLSRASGNGPNAKDGDWNASMNSGMRNSSRVGLRGREDLGNGYAVSFTLENQFKADDGSFQTSGTMWEREASVAVSGPFGKLTMGRLGVLKGPVGTTALGTTNNVDPFGNSMHSFVAGHKTMTSGNYFPVNNAVVYATPNLAGLELFLQYSFGSDKDGGTLDSNDRYMSAAARYTRGPFKATFIVDTIDKADSSARNKQPTTYTAAVNYDFGVVKPYLLLSYFHEGTLNAIGSDGDARYMTASGNYNGAGGIFVLQAPLGPGKAKVGFGYMDAERSEDAAGKNDVTRASVAVGYDWKITKTFDFYADIGYVQQKTETADASHTLRGTEALLGVVKFF